MNLFKKAGTSQQLQKDSDNVLDVFTKTVDSLKEINETADSSISENERKKSEIEKELSFLNGIKSRNENVIAKINKLFAE